MAGKGTPDEVQGCLIHKDGSAAMGKNGGKAADSILTLEEALRQFARKRGQAGVFHRCRLQGMDARGRFQPDPRRALGRSGVDGGGNQVAVTASLLSGARSEARLALVEK